MGWFKEQQQEQRAKARVAAIRRIPELRQWCQNQGIWFMTYNNDTHWKFKHGHGLIQYWPSTHRMVKGENYRRSQTIKTMSELQAAMLRIFLPSGKNLVEVSVPVPERSAWDAYRDALAALDLE